MQKILILPVLTVISILFFSIPTATAADPSLAGVDNFALFSDTYTDTNGGTHLNGDLGYNVPPANFPIVSGVTINPPNPAYTTALTSVNNLYTFVNTPGQSGSCTTTIGVQTTLDNLIVGANPPGTIPPGIYCIGAAVNIATGITLSGDGIYIFRIDGTLNAAAFSAVTLVGAQSDNVFWVPTGGTTIGQDSRFAGIILTRAATTLLDTVVMDGRILSNGAVTTTGPSSTITPSLATIAPPIVVAEIQDSDCVDCVPPTLGLTRDSVRRVDQGFSYNDKSSNAELFLTPIQLATTKVGDVNKAVFKIYEKGGPDEVRHFELIFGLAKGQILGDSKARIELDRSWDGIDTVKVIDPENSLKDVKVETSKGACRTAAVFTDDCLVVTIYHTFAAPLDFNIIATNVWDEYRNAWQNYFSPGIKVVSESASVPTDEPILPVIPTGTKVLISDLTLTKSNVMVGETARVSFKVKDDAGNTIPWVTPDVGICKISAVKPHYVLVMPKSPLANDSDCPFFQSDFLSSSSTYNVNLIIPEGIKEGKYKLDVWADPDYVGQVGVVGDHKSVDITIVGGTVAPVIPTPVKIIKSPLKQVQSGTVVDDVQCKEGLQFVIKASNGAPACVKPATKIILLERGWAKPQA
ncbi:ice-binding family protein [Candidatus Nitrosotenuis sp. DW1]|uniref:ice-binding family protein n=1 Tax=Candidatus Nitrosotenuis sp. DW1 TaxID=2259672 RepID=UPI0015CBA646|nr:ice-binding family protein [Candidatus Nitrosotenuis sp. DW1]QLH09224.1 hypothetical protein DSQ19_06880 [Candidatus Nitrosotenuis sp. DW1]